MSYIHFAILNSLLPLWIQETLNQVCKFTSQDDARCVSDAFKSPQSQKLCTAKLSKVETKICYCSPKEFQI